MRRAYNTECLVCKIERMRQYHLESQGGKKIILQHFEQIIKDTEKNIALWRQSRWHICGENHLNIALQIRKELRIVSKEKLKEQRDLYVSAQTSLSNAKVDYVSKCIVLGRKHKDTLKAQAFVNHYRTLAAQRKRRWRELKILSTSPEDGVL